MTTEQIAKIDPSVFKKVADHIQSINSMYSSTEVCAKMIGVKSRGVWHDLKAENWGRIGYDLFVSVASRAGAMSTWQTVETRNFTKITNAFVTAQKLKAMYALVGETGTGKTTAGEALAQRSKNIVYVLGDATMTRKGFIDAIIKKTNGMAMYSEHIEKKMTRVVNGLLALDAPLLVIDDAGKLPEHCLQLIQIIYDCTRDQAGILLMGTEGLYKRIIRHAESNNFYMRELYGRIGHWEILETATVDDVAAICEHNGIQNASAIQWLNNATVSLHTVSSMIKKAKEFQQETGETVTGEIMAKMNQRYKWYDSNFQNFAERLKSK